jgi:plasmid stabilization system protein ParE
VRVDWSKKAELDIKSIYERYLRHSLLAAENRLRTIRDRTSQLADFPDSGRMMPEFENRYLRELIEGDYRIIYERFPDRIEIVSVAHGRQSFLSGLE